MTRKEWEKEGWLWKSWDLWKGGGGAWGRGAGGWHLLFLLLSAEHEDQDRWLEFKPLPVAESMCKGIFVGQVSLKDSYCTMHNRLYLTGDMCLCIEGWNTPMNSLQTDGFRTKSIIEQQSYQQFDLCSICFASLKRLDPKKSHLWYGQSYLFLLLGLFYSDVCIVDHWSGSKVCAHLYVPL